MYWQAQIASIVSMQKSRSIDRVIRFVTSVSISCWSFVGFPSGPSSSCTQTSTTPTRFRAMGATYVPLHIAGKQQRRKSARYIQNNQDDRVDRSMESSSYPSSWDDL